MYREGKRETDMKRQLYIEAFCILCIQYLRICRMASSYFFSAHCMLLFGGDWRPWKVVHFVTGDNGTTFSTTTFWIIQQYLKTAIPDAQSTGVIFGGSSSRRLVEPMCATIQRIMAKSAEKRAALAGALENMAARKGGKFVQIFEDAYFHRTNEWMLAKQHDSKMQ